MVDMEKIVALRRMAIAGAKVISVEDALQYVGVLN